ncbi:MAG TPA: heme-binding protein [Verrucomicrobiae bacterium]|nr:heme-binding protein [Verrucomicrobiae bacterium]
MSKRIRSALCFCSLAFFVMATGCGGGNGVTVPAPPSPPLVGLTAAEVQTVVENAASSVDAPVVIAVTDRGGHILAVFQKTGAAATATGNFGASVATTELAVALARTAAYFSNDQAPLSSRTVRFISGIHFPPGITNTANAALYGIENTNRGCPLNVTFLPGQTIDPSRSISGASLGLGIITGKVDTSDSDPNAINPGGAPLFRNGRLVGGLGVAGAAPPVAEFAAFSAAASSGFGANPAPPGVVVIDGIALPFVVQTTRPAGSNPGTLAGVFAVGPIASPGPVPEGDLILAKAGLIGGLTLAEVQSIVNQAIATANQTRAIIRLPDGQRARFAIAISDLDGTILALNRMPDATVFSVDVAVAKARNMAYFSSAGVSPADLPGVPAQTAVTNRTISFGAQPLFPPGIDGTAAGPFFNLYQFDLANPCTNGGQPPSANQNGVVFFPGSVPIYKGGVLVGGLGISGDGVEQDDYVSAQAAAAFGAPPGIRADQITLRGVRLPYLKFPRNPTL